MKYTTTLLAAGAGVVSAFPNAVLPRDLASEHPWQAPGNGDVRAPCPGLNTLANHGFLPHSGKGITVDMTVKAFKDGFNMGADIIQSAAGSALGVCQIVTGHSCTSFDLDQLNFPHSFEHDASFTRADFDAGKGNNHVFSQDVFNTVLEVWKDTDIITYSYANAARQMRVQKCSAADSDFQESQGTQLTEVAFYLGTMGTPQDGNARKDWITYWWTHERMPFELGWAPTQRPEHNASTINTMINNVLNAPAPQPVKTETSTSAGPTSTSASVASSSSAVSSSSSAVSVSGTAISSSSSASAGEDKTTAKTAAPSGQPTPSFAANGTAAITKPATTTFLTTSVVYATTEVTVTSCAATVTDCPAESRKPTVITKTLSSFTTVCPVTATMVPGSSVIVSVAPPVSASASASTSASTATRSSPSFTYTTPAAGVTFVTGNIVQPSNTGAAPATSASQILINPYFSSCPASAFPSAPASIISQYSASTGVFAAATYAPEYTQSGSQAIAAATNPLGAPPAAAPSAPPAAATATPPAPTAPAAGGVYGAAPSTAAVRASTATGAPIATGAAVSGKGVSGLLAGVAVAAMLL